MKLKLSGIEFEEGAGYRFRLTGTKLEMVNFFTDSKGVFIDGKDYYIIPKKDLITVRGKLKRANREWVP